MKVRILRLSGAVAIALLTSLAFLTVGGLAAPDGESGRQEAIVSAKGVAAVVARDQITTVIGIDESPLRLSRDGQLVTARGTVECPAAGTYDLRVMIKQKAPTGFAKGETSGACGGNGGVWQARAVGTLHLMEGEAQVCAVVVVHLDKGAATQRSCRTVSLVE